MTEANSTYGLAAYALLISTLTDLAEDGRLDNVERIVEMAERTLDGLAKEGSIDKHAHDKAREAVQQLHRQIGAAQALR